MPMSVEKAFATGVSSAARASAALAPSPLPWLPSIAPAVA